MLKQSETFQEQNENMIFNPENHLVIPSLITDFYDLNKDVLEQAKEIILKSKKILLLTHKNMDMDAMGSAAAIHSILNKIGKEVIAITDRTPIDGISFFGSKEIFSTKLSSDYIPDLLICTDTSDKNFLGIPEGLSLPESPLLVVDHHAKNDSYGDLNIIAGNFSSACEVVFAMLVNYGLLRYITEYEATLLYAGIKADNNAIGNHSSEEHTLIIRSNLKKLGANTEYVRRKLYQRRSLSKAKLTGKLLSNIMEINGGEIVISKISLGDMKEVGASKNEIIGLINELSSTIKGVETACLLYELEKGLVKCSMRSTKHDVGELAVLFGGGGHREAAGFPFEGTLEQVEKILLNAFSTNTFLNG